MTNEKANGQELLRAFTSRYDALINHGETVQLHHHKAFADAALAVLADGRGEIDYKRLNNGDKRVAMWNAMVHYLTGQADKYMPLDNTKLAGDPLLWLKKEQHFMNFAGGISAGALKRMIDSEHDGREKFTLERYAGVASEAKKTLIGQFLPSTFMHLPDTTAAKGAVLSAIGLSGKLDPGKSTLDELVQWMLQFHETGGVVPPKMYQKSAAYIPPGNHGGH